jgi:hypothetical protein
MLPSFLRAPFLLLCGLAFAEPALAADEAASYDWLAPSRFAIGLKYTGLTYHPGGGENEEHYKRSLDSKDFWVLQVGAQADVDYIVNRFFYIRAANALYRDCSDLWAGFHHIGFRANWDATERLSLRIGVGPTFLWRQNWFGKVKGYTKDSFFGPATGGSFQDAFIWYGGDGDVEWRAWDKVSLLYSVIPGYPEVIQNSVGLRYRF